MYDRSYWIAREGTKLNKYTKQNETSSSVELVNAPDAITVPGTEFTAGRMNNIESGVEYANARVDDIDQKMGFVSVPVDYTAQGFTNRSWKTATQYGRDIYYAVNNGEIYKQVDGEGALVSQSASRAWTGIATDGKDVYACIFGVGFAKQTNGTGDFSVYYNDTHGWMDICFDEYGDSYACDSGGGVYKKDGFGYYSLYAQTGGNLRGICSKNNNIYVCDLFGDILKQTNKTGSFVPLGQTNRQWTGINVAGNDIVATTQDAGVFIQYNGEGNFVDSGLTIRAYSNAVPYNNDILLLVSGGDVYRKRDNDSPTIQTSGTLTIPSGIALATRKRIIATGALTINFTGETIDGASSLTLVSGATLEMEKTGATTWKRIMPDVVSGGTASAPGVHIETRSDTATNWASANPVLRKDEVGRESNTGKEKTGDGVTAWNSLGYSNDHVYTYDGLKLFTKTMSATTAAAQGGSVNIEHGLSPEKIVSISGIIRYASTSWIPFGSTYDNGYQADIYTGGPSNENLYIVNSPTNSGNILSKQCMIVIQYTN